MTSYWLLLGLTLNAECVSGNERSYFSPSLLHAVATPCLLSRGCCLNSQPHNLTAHCAALPVS